MFLVYKPINTNLIEEPCFATSAKLRQEYSIGFRTAEQANCTKSDDINHQSVWFSLCIIKVRHQKHRSNCTLNELILKINPKFKVGTL